LTQFLQGTQVVDDQLLLDFFSLLGHISKVGNMSKTLHSMFLFHNS
jgi:hypothetical protein